MNVLLCGDFDAHAFAAWHRALAEAMPEARWWTLDQARAQAAAVNAAVVANPPPGSLQGLPALRLIQSLWAGVDRLLADRSLPAGVPIARMVDPAMNAAMAETALWATLALQRDFFRYARQQRQGRWQQHAQRRADETPVLVLGQGEMGRTTARTLAQAGFVVSGWSRGGSAAEPGVKSLAGDQALWQALPQTQVLINLLPLTPHTLGLLNAPLFATLPRGAGVVNLARGRHLVDDDLLAALDSGQVGHAVLNVARYDVFKLGEAILAGNVARALRMLDGLRAEGEAPVLVHWTLAEDVRALRRVREAVDAGRPLSLALSQARVWGQKEKLFERAVPLLADHHLARWLAAASVCDGLVKGLRHPDWPNDPWDALQRLVLMMLEPLRPLAPAARAGAPVLALQAGQ